MLVTPNFIDDVDPILLLLTEGDFKPKVIQEGVFEIKHFNPDHIIADEIEYYPELSEGNNYGVCDGYQQVLDYYPSIIESDKKYCISVTPIIKSEQPECGGWRWHKWGPYIGNQIPTQEYLYDETDIEKVYVYHIIELKE